MTTGVNNQKAKVVPGIPLAALDAIKDQHTRDVLRALVDGAHVRNGDTGNGDNRFITAQEMQAATTQLNRAISEVSRAVPPASPFVDVGKIVADAQAGVIESPLFRDLGQRVTLIDAPRGLIEQMKGKLIAAANKVASELRDAVDSFPDGVTDLSEIFDNAIKAIRGIKKTLYDPTGALPLAQAAIIEINDVSVDSDSASARKLAGLTATVNNEVTGLAKAHAEIGEINDVSVTSKSANASKLASINAAVNDEETGLAVAHAFISDINDVSVTSKSANASKLAGLTAQLIDPKTGKSYAEGMIATDREINLTNAEALAKEAQVVYASLGAKNRTFVSSEPPTPVAARAGTPYQPAKDGKPAVAAVAPTLAVPMEGDVWYDTSDKMKARRWTGTGWADISDVRIGLAEGAISDEKKVRLAQDSVIVDAIQTVWGALGGNSGLIQKGENITVNTAGAVATAFQQVQAAVKDDLGNVISSSAVKVTAEAAVTKAGLIEGKWTVNIDSGGAATGFRQAGFGIAGSAHEKGVRYAFGVRADSFWVASPADAPLTEGQEIPSARVPFVVKTHEWIDSQGVKQPPGAYLNELFATSAKIGTATITTAHIVDANITTLKLAGNSVMVGVYDQSGGASISPGGRAEMISRTLDLGDGYNSGVIVSGVVSLFSMENASYGVRIYVNGGVAGDLRGSLQGGYPILAPCSGFMGSASRYATVKLEVYNPDYAPGSNKAITVTSSTMSVMGGKR